MTRTKPALILTALSLAVALPACGGDDKSSSGGGGSSSDSTAAAGAPKGAADARAAIQAYFTAKRLGQAEQGCALESERYQTDHYGGVGEPCLQDLANKQPQAVWAEQTKIVAFQETADTATATIEPNAGSPAQATVTLVKSDGGWLVDTLQ
jgi:hypothetical protein